MYFSKQLQFSILVKEVESPPSGPPLRVDSLEQLSKQEWVNICSFSLAFFFHSIFLTALYVDSSTLSFSIICSEVKIIIIVKILSKTINYYAENLRM